jgi:hypothetical protein
MIGDGNGGFRKPFLIRYQRASGRTAVRDCPGGEVGTDGPDTDRVRLGVISAGRGLRALAPLDGSGAAGPMDTLRAGREGSDAGLHGAHVRELASARPAAAVPADRRRGGAWRILSGGSGMEGQLTYLAGASAIATQRPAPVRLGSYRLLQQIGEGGTAVVHLAVGPDDQMVAVKMLRQPGAASPVARSRLAREVTAMRRVRSPFVAEVIDADLAGDVPYIVTTFAAGCTLAQLVADQGPLRGPALKRVAYGLAAGLATVHAAGLCTAISNPAT